MSLPDDNHARFERLTAKQRECLDLVLLRHTSKQIARQLGVSKHAVDQRLTTARQTLGAADREAAARLYASLLRTYDRVAYDALHIPYVPEPTESPVRDRQASAAPELREAPTSFEDYLEQTSGSSFLGVSIGDLGTATRLLIVVGLAAGILVVLLVGLAVAQAISSLV